MSRKTKVRIIVAAAVLVALAVGYFAFWPEARFRDDYLLSANAKDLKATVVTAHLDEPIVPGKNILWCSTFQLAWNEGCALLGEDIHLDNEPAMVAALNRKSATKADLDNGSYVAIAGRTKDGIVEKIRSAMRGKFNREPELPVDIPGARFVAYAYLAKDLEFPVPFERSKQPLRFQGKWVQGFGTTYRSTAQQRRQIAVLCEPTRDNDYQFVIELTTKSPEDRLILACVEPDNTLGRTIDKVHRLIATSSPAEETGIDFMIPKLNFDVLREYAELEGKVLRVSDPRLNGREIFVALQDIRFQMNERGVVLKSEAMVADALPSEFDRPFLILLERRGAKAPYLALWVDNAELLVPAN